MLGQHDMLFFYIIFIYWFCNLLIYSFSILYIFVTSTVLCITPQILRRCGDSVELLNVSNELPELARRPGLSTWKVIHVSKTIHIKYIMLSFMIKCCEPRVWYPFWKLTHSGNFCTWHRTSLVIQQCTVHLLVHVKLHFHIVQFLLNCVVYLFPFVK